MLINLSNHPFEKWGDEQRKTAIQQFESIRDYPFPDINPEANTVEIRQLAQKIFFEIKNENLFGFSVHIMGEFTFCYQFVQLCEENNVPCYLSTTKRDVVIKQNGEKISKFCFVKFRSYI